MKKQMIAAGLLAASGSLLANPGLRLRPDAPRGPGFQHAKGTTTYTACLDYDKRTGTVGRCDTNTYFWRSRSGHEKGEVCPKGSIQVTSTEPIAMCPTPVIL